MGEIIHTFQVGDKVRIPDEGRRGTVAAIRTGTWEDRGGKKWDLPWYQVPSPKSGSPVEWYLYFQLQHVYQPVSGEILGLEENPTE